MKEDQPKHRDMGQTIADLIAHIDWKLSILPESLKAWGLGEDALTALSTNLQRERVTRFFTPRYNAERSNGYLF